ncbi:hypothetical protein BpHYR1_034100 [Brachionus plicatilis]|uniref:Uncharacterized protein n=1 Tax=Brachionus plicatilis TaxID=10195 RepID=A0A3M7PKC5_BRAPC|nr:hypothetical protein BpHYR1_034100 [Brachionus plicatilis]
MSSHVTSLKSEIKYNKFRKSLDRIVQIYRSTFRLGCRAKNLDYRDRSSEMAFDPQHYSRRSKQKKKSTCQIGTVYDFARGQPRSKLKLKEIIGHALIFDNFHYYIIMKFFLPKEKYNI